MKRLKLTAFVLAMLTLTGTLQSCDDDDDDWEYILPTALVTVCPQPDGTFYMQLDNTRRLYASNIKTSPFKDKEVRALVNYTEDPYDPSTNTNSLPTVHINWIDSIRTKKPVPTLGEENAEEYGNDPIEIVRDWVTVAEDGYLTLRIRTLWGPGNTPHYINLVSGVNPDNPYEFELRHDARGDLGGYTGDALIAFNLNELPRPSDEDVKIKLRWRSFSGEKSTEFDLYLRPKTIGNDITMPERSKQVK